LAHSKRSDRSRILRFAVANLLRIARSELDDARVVLERGSQRNALVLTGQALAHIGVTLAASEHGWPLEEWNAGLRAVPEANPLQPDLVEVDALVRQDLSLAVQADGQLAPNPDPSHVVQACDQATAILETVAKTCGVDLGGTGPARHVAPIRPKPTRTPPKPAQKLQHAPPDNKPGPRTDRATPHRKAPVVQKPLPKRPEASRRKAQAETTVVRWPMDQPALKLPKIPVDPKATAPGFAADPRPMEPVRLNHHAPDVSSTAFWSLMDRWKVDDLAALKVIGHPGGLTKKGTRPRFRIMGPEAALFSYLRAIDTALQPMQSNPADWIRQPIKEVPFSGSPAKFVLCGVMRPVGREHEEDRSRPGHTCFVSTS
jgi:hypothetical protein